MVQGTTFRSNLTKDEFDKLKSIAEEKGMSYRGIRDFALRELIRRHEEDKKTHVVVL